MQTNTTYGQIANIAVLEELYQRYQENPSSVDPSWQRFFEGMEFSGEGLKGQQTPGDAKIYELVDRFRRYGHLEVAINPIALEKPPEASQLSLGALGFSEADLSKS